MMRECQAEEDVVVCKDHQLQQQIIKGKRTKRPRQIDVSPTTSFALTESSTGKEEEEEDMANCLLLLSQSQTIEPISSSGMFVHLCKTCNRCFPSFQALGGHRASHKKPQHQDNNDKKDLIVFAKEDELKDMNTSLSLQITSKASFSSCNNKSRVHECSICGAEFSSGQALGGHMRRHRTLTVGSTRTQPKKLQLDLNLPAPEEDNHHHKELPKLVSFEDSKGKLLVFSASKYSLVDCHY